MNTYSLTRQIALSQDQILKMLNNMKQQVPVTVAVPCHHNQDNNRKVFIPTTPPINRQLAISEKQITNVLKKIIIN